MSRDTQRVSPPSAFVAMGAASGGLWVGAHAAITCEESVNSLCDMSVDVARGAGLAARSGRGNMKGMQRLSCMLVLLGLAACAPTGTSARSLHYVDDELVYSNPPSALSYEAYLRARFALSTEPPLLEQARSEIEVAIHYDRRAAHLWSTKAEIAALQGQDDVAISSANKALALRPGYAPAQAVLVEVRGGPKAASVTE